MKVPVYRALGALSVLLGIIGAFLPLMPTTPFLILAAWFFARSHPEWEVKLLAHPKFGPAIRAWRDRQAIPRVAKWASTIMMSISVIGSWFILPEPWGYGPAVVCGMVAAWMWTRPSA